MIHVALYQPEIPPNTGNIIRLCANAGAMLHLIHPLGFRMDDRDLKRASLDYHEYAEVKQHASLDTLLTDLPESRLLAFSSKGVTSYHEITYRPGDILMFGPETRGLPATVLDALPAAQRLRIPMRPGNRSLNLSNAVAVAVYETWRQQGFS
jgi:tRNA (cytidine/uridine-2'-O-)-methyltransferase